MPEPNTFFVTLAAVSVAVLSAGAVFAQQSSPDRAYSATAIHGLPGQPTTSGAITKSGQNMRLEFEQNGHTVVQILLPEQGVMYILDPSTKTYMEMRGQAGPPPPEAAQLPPVIRPIWRNAKKSAAMLSAASTWNAGCLLHNHKAHP